MNRFGVELHPDRLRWAAAESVSEDVIAAVLLLHERSVDEIAPKLSPTELEQTIVLVGRNPLLYPPGTLQALESASVSRRRPVGRRCRRTGYQRTPTAGVSGSTGGSGGTASA